MIGMSQIKKKTIQGILIGASVGIVVAVGVSVFSFFTIKSYKDGTNNDYVTKIENTINSIKDTMISENKNLTLQEIEQIKQDVSIDINVIENTQNAANANGMYFISNYLILFILLLCLSKIANTISQEKMSKSIEYILTSITTKQYIISKVLSICFTVIIQFIFMVAYIIVALMISTIYFFEPYRLITHPLFILYSKSRIVAMSFCEPRSCQ